jgi:hypothetical protein
MKEERITRLLRNRFGSDRQKTEGQKIEGQKIEGQLAGFTTNPFANVMSPLQAQLYQAAFLHAQEVAQRSTWPEAECWN